MNFFDKLFRCEIRASSKPKERVRRSFLAQDRRIFDNSGTDSYQEDLSIRTEADSMMILLGRFTIYSLNGIVKTVTDSDLLE